MKAVYKWRLENGVYGYITDEQDASAFIYDQTTFEREYPDGTVISGTYVDEPLIANIVSKKSKAEYTEMFNEFKAFVNIEYPDVAFLDVMYYYNVENDECSASAGSLKCAGADVLFRVKDVTSGLVPKVTVEPINSNPENGDLTYDMSFVLPVSMVSGGTNVFSALTSNTINVVSSVTAEEFVKNGGTNEQYLMADGSISVLSAGTNVTISTATTTYGKVVTVSSKDTNTWRNVNVNGSQILNNSITSGLTLSAGTNVSLAVTTNGTNKVVTINSSYNDTNTWRNVNVNGTQILDNRIVSGLTLSAGTNVTLTVTESGNNKVVKISSSAGVYENGTNVKIGGDSKINAEGYYFDSGLTNVTLFDKSFTGLKVSSTYDNSGVITNINPIGVVDIGDIVLVNNVQYRVTNVSAGPPSIIFERRFEGAASGTKIYKISQTGTTDRKNASTAERSFAAGTGTVAYKKSMTAIGEYNEVENAPNKSDILFAIGNGTSTKKSNAFIVRKDGSIHIHSTEDPSTEKHYGGRIDFGDGTGQKANVYIEESGDDELKFRSTNFTFTTDNASVFINEGANITATVNGIKSVFLGVPIGSMIMWSGPRTDGDFPESYIPERWFLCNGDPIILDTDSASMAQKIQGKSFSRGAVQNLVNILGNTYGTRYAVYYEEMGWVQTINHTGGDHPESCTNDINEALIIETDTLPASYQGHQKITHSCVLLPDFRGMFPIGAGQAPNTYLGPDSQNLGWEFHLGQNNPNVGEYRHKLTVDEMPSHSHNLNNIDGGDENIYPVNGEERIDYFRGIDLNPKTAGVYDEVPSIHTIQDNTSITKPVMTSTGGSQVHKNVPPFIVLNFIIKYA